MTLRNKAFHQLRQLFQQHTARWQHELPDLTKPQYAVMRAIADKPGSADLSLRQITQRVYGFPLVTNFKMQAC